MSSANKNIPLKGIVRNTSLLSVQDGEMEEFINLVHKDGTIKPARECEVLDVNIKDYTDIFVHSSGYRNMIGKLNDALYWFAKAEKGETEYTNITGVKICDCSGDFSHAQTGNLLTIINNSNMYHILFNVKTQSYNSALQAGFNGEENSNLLPPNDLIEFKTEGEVDSKGRYKYASNETKYTSSSLTLDELKIELNAVLEETIAKCKTENLFNEGYFLVCTAYELYDGSFALNSRPLLMSPCGVSKFINNSVDTTNLEKDEYDISDKITDYNSYGFTINARSKTNYISLSLTNNHVFSRNYIGKLYNKTPLKDTNYTDVDVFSNVSVVAYSLSSSDPNDNIIDRNTLNELIPLTLTRHGEYCNCMVPVQKLKYRIKKDIDSSYEDIIQGVSIFISKPIRAYKTDDFDIFSSGEDNETIFLNGDTVTPETYTVGTGGKSGVKWVNGVVTNVHPHFNHFTIFPQNKEIDDLKDEIASIDSFYEVLSIPFNKIKKSNDWIEVKPDDGVMTNLTAQQRLTEDTYSRTSIYPETVFSYNGRLHLANYKTSLFDGFPLNYFQYWGGLGQQNAVQRLISNKTAGETTLQWYIKTTIESDEGDVEVMRYYKDPIGSYLNNLNPFLSYPDARATKMEVCVNFNHVTYSLLTFNLKEHKFLNLAYYIGANLDSIDLHTLTTTEPKELPDINRNNYSAEPNSIRVSMTENPMVFPSANTYKIGNAKIIGFASNSTDLSTGQVGSAPLYVFSGDGIFALFVDSTGSLAYTSSRPLAMDVVNNSKSITTIDGGILFSTERGLMVLSGSQVQDISNYIEGLYNEPLSSSSQGYLPECAIIENNDKVVQIKDLFTGEEFKDYLENSIIAYEYKEKEIFIANSDKDYVYVFKDGLWSKRGMNVTQFVNDYPRTYIKSEGMLFKLGTETDRSTDTSFITRPISFNTTGLKQSNSVVLRGNFELESELQSRDIETFKAKDVKELTVEFPSYEEVKIPDSVQGETQTIDGADELEETDYEFASEITTKANLLIPSIFKGDVSFNNDSVKVTLNKSGTNASVTVVLSSDKTDELKNNTYENTGDKTILAEDIAYNIAHNESFPESVRTMVSQNGVFLQFVFLKQLNVHVVVDILHTDNTTTQGECDLISSERVGSISFASIYTDIPSTDVTSVDVSSVSVTQTDTTYKFSAFSNYERYDGKCYILFDIENYLNNTSKLLVMYQQNVNTYDGSVVPVETNVSFLDTLNTYKKDTISIIDSDKFISKNITIRYNPIYDVPLGQKCRLVIEQDKYGYDFTSNEAIDDEGSYLKMTSDEIVEYINNGTFIEDIKITLLKSQNLTLTINLSEGGVFNTNIYNINSYETATETTYLTFKRAYLLGAIPLALTSGSDVLVTLTKGHYYYFSDIGSELGEAYKYIKANTTETLSYGTIVDNVLNNKYEIGVNRWNKVLTLPIDENIQFTSEEDEFLIYYRYLDDPRVQDFSDAEQKIIFSDFIDMFDEGVFSTNIVHNDPNVRVRLYPPENIIVLTLDGDAIPILYKSNPTYDFVAKNVLTAKELSDLVLDHPEYFGEQVLTYDRYAGLYVYGSHDAKVWRYLGGNEKSGIFNDIGCVTNRTDCKFFKVVFAGHLSKNSRIDFLEWTAKTKLDKKSR